MTPIEALVPALVEQYGAGAVALVVLYRRVGRVESAVDELREHVDANAERIRYDPRPYPRGRDYASTSTTAPPPTPTSEAPPPTDD